VGTLVFFCLAQAEYLSFDSLDTNVCDLKMTVIC